MIIPGTYQIIYVTDEDLTISLDSYPLFRFINCSDYLFYSPLLFSYN
jgi:hypothetical protein